MSTRNLPGGKKWPSENVGASTACIGITLPYFYRSPMTEISSHHLRMATGSIFQMLPSFRIIDEVNLSRNLIILSLYSKEATTERQRIP
jgi:hypothetical protein